jgi:hypothetical protein
MKFLDRFSKFLDRSIKLLWMLFWVILIGGAVMVAVTRLSNLNNDAFTVNLCRQATACKKYSKVREECATAGSFKTCLRIKMGDDAHWIDTCNGYVEGGPALPPPPETPNSVECFFSSLF